MIDTNTNYYLVLEHIEGVELFDQIVAQGRLPEGYASMLFAQLVEAVDHCHKSDVAHRDLKPENIMVTPKGKLKLIDFGLSNIISKKKLMTTSCGTKCYSAPETFSKAGYNPVPADVWSLGILLYVMVCGELPFDVRL